MPRPMTWPCGQQNSFLLSSSNGLMPTRVGVQIERGWDLEISWYQLWVLCFFLKFIIGSNLMPVISFFKHNSTNFLEAIHSSAIVLARSFPFGILLSSRRN